MFENKELKKLFFVHFLGAKLPIKEGNNNIKENLGRLKTASTRRLSKLAQKITLCIKNTQKVCFNKKSAV
jgi:hypothetical protein